MCAHTTHVGSLIAACVKPEHRALESELRSLALSGTTAGTNSDIKYGCTVPLIVRSPISL